MGSSLNSLLKNSSGTKVSGVRSSIFTYASYQANKPRKLALTTCKFLYQFRSMIPDAEKHTGPVPEIEKGEFIKQYMRKYWLRIIYEYYFNLLKVLRSSFLSITKR